MTVGLLKQLLPDRPVRMRVLAGPFRGARVVMNPRVSIRKVLGLYEHELNRWIERALPRVTRVLDVGANDGYFTFGCAAAFRRLGMRGSITAFEAQLRHVEELRASVAAQPTADISIDIVHGLVGRHSGGDRLALDDWPAASREHTLIKLDVEGAEDDVIAGAGAWLTTSNLFVIEVHRLPLIATLRETFRQRGLNLDLIGQRPLPIIGREVRDADNWWLVSTLS